MLLKSSGCLHTPSSKSNYKQEAKPETIPSKGDPTAQPIQSISVEDTFDSSVLTSSYQQFEDTCMCLAEAGMKPITWVSARTWEVTPS